MNTIERAVRHMNKTAGTHSEIAAVTLLDWLQVARRLPELERAGLVRKGEPRICTIKHSKCCTWWLRERDSTDTLDGTGGGDRLVTNRVFDTKNGGAWCAYAHHRQDGHCPHWVVLGRRSTSGAEGG